MGRSPQIALYCEDSGHEQFARALLNRLARAVDLRADIRTLSGRGGHARALKEFRLWQRTIGTRQGLGQEIPDLLILLIDANCKGWAQVRNDLEASVNGQIFPFSVVGCPDPHVERWCLADPVAVQQVLDIQPPSDPGKCDRHIYKQMLRQTIRAAGQPILTNEMEYAPDLVEAMDFYRAGKSQPSLKHFIEEIQRALLGLLAHVTV
jgi:hypothetical protein